MKKKYKDNNERINKSINKQLNTWINERINGYYITGKDALCPWTHFYDLKVFLGRTESFTIQILAQRLIK